MTENMTVAHYQMKHGKNAKQLPLLWYTFLIMDTVNLKTKFEWNPTSTTQILGTLNLVELCARKELLRGI